jgi:autotransporter-associated beta strand protein
MYGVNSYNGTTTVKQGTLVIPTGGSLVNCGTTVVAGTGSSTGNSASLNLGGAAGVVQVGTNGFVRGYTSGSTTTLGTITSLQVQDTGTVEVPVGTTWTTGGTISFTGASTKISVTGTPVAGNTYTLITAAANITGLPTLVSSANTVGWGLRVTGSSIYLEEVGVITIASGSQTYSAANTVTGSIPLTKRGAGTLILDAANDYSGGTVVEAGTLQVQNANGLGTGAVTLKGGTLKSTVDLDLAKLASTTSTVGATTPGYTDTYGLIADYVKYTGNSTTLSGPVTLDVATGSTMTMLTLVGNSDANSLVTKIGAGTVKLMGGSTTGTGNVNSSTVMGGWRIVEGTVWFTPSSNNGGGTGPITLAGGTAKFSKLQNSNGTFTGYEVPSDLTVESNGFIQYDPSPLTLLGQNNLGFKNLSIGASALEVATATTSTVQGQDLPSVNFKSVTLTGSATLKNPTNLDLNLQAVSGTGGFTKTGLGTVYLSDQPNQAAAFAKLTSGMTVESISVENAGNGYATAPAVTLEGGGAITQATATANIDGNGRVTSVTVNTVGSGYTSLPRVVIAAPATVVTANSYTGATVVQEGSLNLNGNYASSFTVKSGAALKLDWLAPAQAKCSIDAISSGTSGYLTNPANAYVKDLYLTKSVRGYTPGATLNLTIAAPSKTDGTGLVPGGLAATATATVNSDGVISALNIVSGGSGYVIAPMVTIPAPTVPTVVARTTGSITFESGARLSLNITPASASYTLLTADGGITGTPVLETSIPGYELTKSSDGKNLLLEVVKTTPTITVNPTAAAIVYGQTLASAGLSDGSASVRGTFAFTSPSTAPEVGTSSQSVTFTPTDTTQYNTVQLNVSVTVSKANPATVFPTAATITYGQALSAVTLTGGTGAGTYAFTSPATIPNAGLTQNFEMTFTPSVPANYNTVTQMVSVSVNKATPTVSVAPTASAVTVGDQLSTSNLSGGTASVAGTYAWTTPGTVVDSSRSYPVTFNPADGANYNTASTSASVTANSAGTTYSGWLSGNGGAASDTAFLNYVFGAVTAGTLDPSLKPTVAVSGSNLVLTYNVRQGTVGLTVTAQTSADLATGAAGWGTSGITDVAVGAPRTVNGVIVQQRTASVSASGGKKFVRLKAVQN